MAMTFEQMRVTDENGLRIASSLQSVRDRWIEVTKHDGFDGDFDILLEAINYLKRGPFAARLSQGAQGEAVAVISGSDVVIGRESRSLHWLVKDPYAFAPGTKLYTHPTERAAVPDEKPLPDLMLASYHEAVGWNACRQAMLTAAPQPPDGTLVCKPEKKSRSRKP